MFREYDETGDIKAGTFWYGRESVAANVATQIQLWFRENPLDQTEGIDWKTEFNDPREGRLAGQIRDVAFKCDKVLRVSETVEFTPIKDRKVGISFSIETEYGIQKVEVSVDANNN
ncbi:TPA: hypothetical protein VGT17_005223 [Vibrio harveyi]|nr:hypothetical protein [Vibrio harveyi]HEQ3599255.1 hypothetical protein [Vibrio harveyi]HEQ3611313.1 hypothetical protein [Vibrio harveyi]